MVGPPFRADDGDEMSKMISELVAVDAAPGTHIPDAGAAPYLVSAAAPIDVSFAIGCGRLYAEYGRNPVGLQPIA